MKQFTHPVLGRVDGYANLPEYEHDVGFVEPDFDDDPPEEEE